MALKYYDIYVNNLKSSSIAQSWKDDLQAVINDQFENSPSYNVIEEELSFGDMNWCDVGVRINHVMNKSTGEKLPDDFKEILFKDLAHARGLGYRYQFNNSVWLTISSDIYKFATASSTIRRCNNVLRWKDSNDESFEQPCVIDYKLQNNEFDFNASLINAEGDINVILQGNRYSNNLKINDRFILNNQAFKIRAMNNFLNDSTDDNDSVALIYLALRKDNVSANDDLINRIADNTTNTTTTPNSNIWES